jgi:hypothetical protein
MSSELEVRTHACAGCGFGTEYYCHGCGRYVCLDCDVRYYVEPPKACVAVHDVEDHWS